MCPNCRGGKFHRHGSYEKYHGPRRLTIQRVLCLGCWVTHALIPEHSLPQTSQDTFAVTTYLWNRGRGESRRSGGAEVLGMGFSGKTLKNLEHSFARCSHNLAALLGFDLPPRLNLMSVADKLGLKAGVGFLLEANRLALARGVNAVYNSRSSILVFHDRRPRSPIPHKLGSAPDSRPPPDSS